MSRMDNPVRQESVGQDCPTYKFNVDDALVLLDANPGIRNGNAFPFLPATREPGPEPSDLRIKNGNAVPISC